VSLSAVSPLDLSCAILIDGDHPQPCVLGLPRRFFEGGRRDTPVYLAHTIAHGHEVPGPALVVDSTSTIVVEPNCACTCVVSQLPSPFVRRRIVQCTHASRLPSPHPHPLLYEPPPTPHPTPPQLTPYAWSTSDRTGRP
jgi:hypothetical protein